MCTALASLMTGKRVRPQLAMTGEMTLSGHVLPVGGVKDKILGAARAGIREIILPERNRDDLEALSPEVRTKMIFHYVGKIGEVLEHALGGLHPAKTQQKPAEPKRASPARRADGGKRRSATAKAARGGGRK